jgi:hypothetical protein
MAEFGKIDDPVDASFGAWPEESGDLGKKASELALSIGGLGFPPAKVFRILKDQFANPSRFARIEVSDMVLTSSRVPWTIVRRGRVFSSLQKWPEAREIACGCPVSRAMQSAKCPQDRAPDY